MLYRRLLKELVQYKSVRKKSLITFARLSFRRRGNATEKLLIDECIEEARRAIYILDKHNQFHVTKEYKFDDMYLPKDTGQDVEAYMEEVFDPIAARGQWGELGHDQIAPNEGIAAERGAQNPLHDSKTLWGGGGTEKLRQQRLKKKFEEETERAAPTNFRPPPPPGSTQGS